MLICRKSVQICFMYKRWLVAPEITKEEKDKSPEINPVVLQLLYNRNIKTPEAINEFLNPDYGRNVPDPFLFRDMEKVVEKIFETVKNGKKIVVHGDYDADGVTSSIVLVDTLKALGAKVDVYLPHRELEGYGLNLETVKKLAEGKCDLIITCDCGIANVAEIKLAKELGLEVIVTDHHHAPEHLPDCLIINPKVKDEKYPFLELAGVGVAFKVAQGLVAKAKGTAMEFEEGFEKWLLDLVAIGTITDCSPLIGENRTLVKYGLIVLNKTRRVGLRKIVKQAGLVDEEWERLKKRLDLDTYNIGFHIGPRLNAAGRINHANQAYELLTTTKEEEAEKLAEELEKVNKERQKITEKITKEVDEQVKDKVEDKALFGLGESWPVGVVGLVAGKIKERYNRPTIVMTKVDNEIVGSGRSIPEFNIVETLEKLERYLARYGGHSQACGFTLKEGVNLEEFKTEFKKIAFEVIDGQDISPFLEIDAEIKIGNVSWEVFREIEKFEPFGENNPYPLFLIKDVLVEEMRTVGKDNHHLKMKLANGGNKKVDAIGFCFADPDLEGFDWCRSIKQGDMLNLVAEINKNQWNGNQELQLKITDLKKTDLSES